jgi:DNA mismatch repair ATPase MutS
VLQVVAVAATFCEVWSAAATLIAELDVLAGFADLATADPTRPYCKPEILEQDDGLLELKVRGGAAPTMSCIHKSCGVSAAVQSAQ